MKGASFWVKAAGAAVLAAALGAVAAVVVLKHFFPEPKLRAMTVDAAKRQLGRDVRLEGVGVGLRGLRLTGLEISEKPDFAAGTFVRVESFRLRPSWKALLKRRLVVASVSADGLKVRVAKGADGRFNYETLGSSAAAPAAAAAPTTEPAPELDVRRASVSNGALEYADQTTGAAWTVSDLDLDLRGFSLAAPFDVTTSLRARGRAGARPVDAKVSFKGSVDLARGDRAAFKADVKRLVVEAEGLTLSASGKAAGLDAPKVSFDADLSAAGKDLLHASGAAALGAAIDVDVKAKTPGLDTTWLAALAPQAGVPALKLPAAELAAAGTYASDRVEVRAFKAAWSGGKIEGAGSARGLGGAKPVFDGKAAFGVDVPPIAPGQYPFLKLPPRAFVPAARVDGEVALSGDELKIVALKAALKAGTVGVTGSVKRLGTAKPAPDVAVALALDLPAFKAADLPVAVSGLPPALLVPALRVDGSVRVVGDDVRLDKLTVKAKGGRVTLDGTVAKALAGAPVPDVSATADLDLPALTDKDLPFPQVPAGLRTPPSRWTADLSYSPKLVKIRSLRLVAGRNDLDVAGSVTDPAGRGAFDLLLKCRSFALDELTALTPQTRDLKLGGTGYFALSVTGVKEKPLFAGKLRFQGLGATVAELPFSDFNGTVSFDERRVDVPNLTGKVGDGTLKMDLTVKDYARFPEIQLEADLDRFDLGRWLAAKSKVQSDRAAAKAAKPAAASAEEKPKPIATRGHFNVGKLIHPAATVEDVKAGWDLRGVTPDFATLDGDAKLHIGGGRIRNVGEMATQSVALKIMLFPLLILQKAIPLGGIGGLGVNLNDFALNQYVGDYGFKDGLMTLRQSELDTTAARVVAQGTIDLPRQGLNLDVVVGGFAVGVRGTFDNPKTKVDLGKTLNPAALLQKLVPTGQ